MTVFAFRGHNLPDVDPWPADDSDPYVKVVAYDSNGHSVTRHTGYIGGNHNPIWHGQHLNFGRRIWTKFTVQVYDADDFLTDNDDPMSDVGTYYLHWHTTGTSDSLDCYRGNIEFKYKFVP